MLSEAEGFFGAASPSSIHAFYCIHHHAGLDSLLARLRDAPRTLTTLALPGTCVPATIVPEAKRSGRASVRSRHYSPRSEAEWEGKCAAGFT